MTRTVALRASAFLILAGVVLAALDATGTGLAPVLFASGLAIVAVASALALIAPAPAPRPVRVRTRR